MNEQGIQRLGKQCRERWYNHLSPDVRKDPWSEEEDKIIIESQQKYGPKWTTISSFLKGRTPNSIKNRWNSTLKKTINGVPKRKRRKTLDEALLTINGRTQSPFSEKTLKRRKSNGDLAAQQDPWEAPIMDNVPVSPNNYYNQQVNDEFYIDFSQMGPCEEYNFHENVNNAHHHLQWNMGEYEKKNDHNFMNMMYPSIDDQYICQWQGDENYICTWQGDELWIN